MSFKTTMKYLRSNLCYRVKVVTAETSRFLRFAFKLCSSITVRNTDFLQFRKNFLIFSYSLISELNSYVGLVGPHTPGKHKKSVIRVEVIGCVQR